MSQKQDRERKKGKYSSLPQSQYHVITFKNKGETVFFVDIFPLHDTVVDGKRLVVMVEFDGGFSALIGQGGKGE